MTVLLPRPSADDAAPYHSTFRALDPRALPFSPAGHEIHHRRLLADRYLARDPAPA